MASFTDQKGHNKIQALVFLFLLLPLPSVGVFFSMAFPITRGTSTGQTLYFLTKTLFYAVPIVFFIYSKCSWAVLWPVTKRLFIHGIYWGLLLAITISAGFFLALIVGIDFSSIRAAATQNGLTHLWQFCLLAIYLSFINSLMEEFVWRDFIFRQWSMWLSPKVALLLTNLGFTLHHSIALLNQTGFWPTVFGSLAVFSAGCFWSWLYLRHRSLWPAYLSHILADLVIFTWGGWIIFA